MVTCFKVATKFRSLYFIVVKEDFASRDMFILGHVLRKFLAVSSTTMESLPQKELDLGLQNPTGPLGVAASILLTPQNWTA